MGAMASQITSLTIINPSVYWGADPRKHQSSASLAFVWPGIHRWPVNSPHKWPVTRKMFPFDDVTMQWPGLKPTKMGRRWWWLSDPISHVLAIHKFQLIYRFTSQAQVILSLSASVCPSIRNRKLSALWLVTYLNKINEICTKYAH